MTFVSNYLLPMITLLIIIYALIKKRPIYDDFINGVKEGLSICLKIGPSIFAMVVSVSVFINGGFLSFLINNININFFPKELFPLALLRPVSGSSSLMLLSDILNKCGVDSQIGIIASIITASTDTTIYIIATYFGSINVKKIKYALIVGLLADMMCVFISYLIVNV